jgi:hypothetical protein
MQIQCVNLVWALEIVASIWCQCRRAYTHHHTQPARVPKSIRLWLWQNDFQVTTVCTSFLKLQVEAITTKESYRPAAGTYSLEKM